MKGIFEVDEHRLIKVNPKWRKEAILRKKGVFLLKDIADILKIDSALVKKLHKHFAKLGKDPYTEIGVKKVLSNWYIRMKIFGPFFKNHIEKVAISALSFSKEELLSKKSFFYIPEVCAILSIKTSIVMYQAITLGKAKDMGVVKNPCYFDNRYILDMRQFSLWYVKYYNS